MAEDIELLKLRAKAKLKVQQQQQSQEIETDVEPSTMEALSAGFVEGVPFMKDAIAGVDAVTEQVASEDPLNLDQFVDRYRDNMEDINRTINMSEELAPGTTMAGDIVGGAVSSVPAGLALKGAALVGAASGLSRSEDRGLEDVVSGAALGVGGQVAGQALGKAVKAPLAATGKFLKARADEAISAVIGADRAYGASRLFNRLKISGQSKEEFINSVRKTGIIQAGDDSASTLTKVTQVKEKVGKELGTFYKQVDDQFKPEIDVKSMKQRLNDDVVAPFANSDDPGMREVGESLTKYIDDLGVKRSNMKSVLKPSGATDANGQPIMVKEITEDIIQDEVWTLSRTHQLQKDIRNRISSIFKNRGVDATNAKEQQRKVAASIGEIIDDTLDTVSTPENPVFNQVKDLRLKFGNMATIEELVENKLAKSADDPMSMVKQMFGFRSMLLTGLGANVAGPAGAVAGFALNKVINDPKTPTYIANGLPAIASKITGDMSGKIASRLTLASTLSSDKFRTALEGSIAEVNLKSNPISRNTQEALTSSKDIQKLLKYHRPSMLKAYNKLLESGNETDMAAFLDGLSKSEEAQPFFQEGVGFNNMVFDPQDKATLEKQLRNTDMPTIERMKLLKDMHENGNIPDTSKVEPRQPNKYVPRNKDEFNY